jgi:predicted transcriptional regulator
VSTTIRVSDQTRGRIASLAAETGRQMGQVVEDAVEALERKVFFDRLNERFRELRSDPAAWAAMQAERAVEEATLGDGSG